MADMTFLVGGSQMRTADGTVHSIAATKINMSSNRTTQYTLIEWSNGDLSCNCPGWAIRKDCKHCKAARANGGLDLVRGGTVAMPAAPPPPPPPPVTPGRRTVRVRRD